MDDWREAEALIERVVRDAHIPGRAAREELRRELATHFEEAAVSPERLKDAVLRFGDPDVLRKHFDHVYRWDYFVLYLAKLAASVIVSVAVALLVQVLVNLRVEIQAEAVRLSPGFPKAAMVSVAVVLGLVTAWEIGRSPFDRRRAGIAVAAYAAICGTVQWLFASGLQMFGPATVLVFVGYASSRLEQRPAKLLRTFALFAVATYIVHLRTSVPLGAGRAVMASVALLAVWTSTVAVLSRLDHAFFNVFTTPGGGR